MLSLYPIDYSGEFVLYSDWLKQHSGSIDLDALSDISIKFGLEKSQNSVPILGGDGRISHNKVLRLVECIEFYYIKSFIEIKFGFPKWL